MHRRRRAAHYAIVGSAEADDNVAPKWPLSSLGGAPLAFLVARQSSVQKTHREEKKISQGAHTQKNTPSLAIVREGAN